MSPHETYLLYMFAVLFVAVVGTLWYGIKKNVS